MVDSIRSLEFFETLPQPHFKPRYLVGNDLVVWPNVPLHRPALIIQSAIKGGPAFEPKKIWELQQLTAISQELSGRKILGVHSYAGPQAPEQVISLESEEKSVAPMLANIKYAYEAGWRGVVINDCMADPSKAEFDQMAEYYHWSGLEMVAPGYTSMHEASEHGPFAIVGVGADVIPIFKRLANLYELKDRIVGIFIADDLNPIDLESHGLQNVAKRLFPLILQAQDAGANAVVFGCTTLGGTLKVLLKLYPELAGYPLIEPIPITLRVAVEKVKKMQ